MSRGENSRKPPPRKHEFAPFRNAVKPCAGGRHCLAAGQKRAHPGEPTDAARFQQWCIWRWIMWSRLLATAGAFVMLLMVAAVSSATAGAEPGPAQRAGKAVDKAADDTGKALKKAGEKLSESVETAGRAVERAGKKTGEAVDRAMEKTGEAITHTGEKIKPSEKK